MLSSSLPFIPFSFLFLISYPNYTFPSSSSLIMDFFLELLLTAILSLFFSFLVSKLVSVAMGGRENDPTSDQSDMDGFVTSALKMNVPVLESQRNFRVVDENVETVDRYGIEADRVLEPAMEAESTEIVIVSTGQISGEGEELMVQTMEEAMSAAFVSPERVVVEEPSACVVESEEARVESSNAMEESEEEEDDDWEGIERSELEKAFVAAVNFLEESGKAEEIGADAKMELYGLHKIATEGSCRVTQPMAVMVSARAKWNAWKKLGNMNQEEAMEQYLTLVSKEFPAYNVGKMPEMVTSVGLNPLS